MSRIATALLGVVVGAAPGTVGYARLTAIDLTTFTSGQGGEPGMPASGVYLTVAVK